MGLSFLSDWQWLHLLIEWEGDLEVCKCWSRGIDSSYTRDQESEKKKSDAGGGGEKKLHRFTHFSPHNESHLSAFSCSHAFISFVFTFSPLFFTPFCSCEKGFCRKGRNKKSCFATCHHRLRGSIPMITPSSSSSSGPWPSRDREQHTQVPNYKYLTICKSLHHKGWNSSVSRRQEMIPYA